MKNYKKFVPALMAAMMLSSSAISVCAAEPADTDTEYNVGYTEASAGTTRDTTVTYSEDASFVVTIPKSITLAQGTKDADYQVKVTGSITGDKKVTVAPKDDVADTDGVNFLMKDQGTIKKADVPATVTQDVVDWGAVELDDAGDTGVSKGGYVVADGLTAGTWQGVMTFDIALNAAE